jgi:uncharacterized protein YwqG
MKQDIIEKINSTQFSESTKQDIINNLTTRYLIEKEKVKIKIGESKIGGFPHLPKDLDYPQEENFFYEFIGQINLSDLKENDIPNFPKFGIMYFFIDDDFEVSNVTTKVILLNNDISELEVKYPPKNKKSHCEIFLNRTEFTELKLRFAKDLTINQNLLNEIVNYELVTGQNNQSEFDIEQFYTKDQVWGFTTTWGGGDAEWSAYLAKRRFSSLYWLTLDHQIENLKKENIDFRQWLNNKVDEAIIKQKDILLKYEKTLHIYPYWENELVDLEYTKENLADFIDNFEHHKLESKKWKMVLSLSSENDAQMCFGDGKMEFFVNSDDLANKNFNNFYCHIYN